MTSKAFWTEYFEDAYRDAAKKRHEVIDRGLLLIAHLIREHLPTATAISVDGSALTAVHDGEGTIWQLSHQRGTLSRQTRRHIRDTLLDMRSLSRSEAPFIAADWTPASGNMAGLFRVALPEDPDKNQAQNAAPADDDRPHGTPGEDAGNCAQCGRLLIWDGTGKRVNDERGERLCSNPRRDDAKSAVHVLPALEPAQQG
ncbi:hypothetical protein [Streptomyces sp. NPDC006334]|uniref:hypothetical protein n=1 Tax=Streptomyces sp. NPDC006334 TaxID=3156754 RepID=UPI0033BE5C40